MLQIRKIREYTPRGSNVSKKFDSPLEPDLTVENIKDLFTKLPDIVERIPETERYNIFYTLGHRPEDSKDPKHRKWSWQEVIPFDIDDIDVENDSVNPKYIEAIGEALGVDLQKCVTMFSGNGLQILIKPKYQITDVKWFKTNQKYYQTLVSKVNDKLFEYGLGGKADPSAFEANRLFRLPLTFNKKPGKPERQAKLITDNLEPLDFDLKAASGLPDVEDSEQLTERQLGYFKVDTEAVLDGCDFLKYMKENTQNVTEPEWYAGLSVLSRLNDGENLCHEYSEGHQAYNKRDTDRKIQQSLDASGPRTCDNIHKLWGRCRECPNYKKVPSPISLKGPNFIATSTTGFHLLTKKGALVPQYEDLRRYYDLDGHYVNVGDVHYKFKESYYQELKDRWIDHYAQDNFNPACDNKKASEFRGLVKRTNLEDENFFQATTNRRINLLNGVLGIDTMNLEKHDPGFGFKHCLNFNYDPIATAPTFEKHLTDVTQGNESLRKILLEYMGYCLANDKPRAQKMLVLTGSGQNGKSTFLEILRAIGGDGVTSLGPRELANGFYRQQLDGTMFNIIEEMPAFADKNFWEDMKALITGAPVTASKKNKDPYTFECRTKFIMTCNELPKGANPNHGYYRRLLIVPFNAKFQGQADDKFIAERIINEELPGVLNLVLEAYHNLRTNQFTFSQSNVTENMLEEYKLATDNVARWCQDHLEIGADLNQGKGGPRPEWIVADASGTPCADVGLMYKEYRVWADDEGEHAVSKIHFSRRVSWWTSSQKDLGQVSMMRVRIGSSRTTVLYGASWKV